MDDDSTSLSETICLSENNSFADLIQREVIQNLQRYEQEKKQHLVLKKYIPTFSEEIRCMMHTHGDVKDPLAESVLLMGTILRDQMNMLLVKATAVRPVQKGNALSHEHLLPLLLQNKRKLKRLLYYLKMKDTKDVIFKKVQPIGDLLIDGVEHGKRVRTCLEFLLKIDESFDTVSIMDNSVADPVTVKRQKRRYVVTYYLSEPEYLEYSRKLQASFYPKGGSKLFMKWLLTDNVTHLVPSELALEIINFLAYETIAEIVELCLRLKYNRNSVEPIIEEAKETKAVDNNNLDRASSDINAGNENNTLDTHSVSEDPTVKESQQNSAAKEDCSASNINSGNKGCESYLSEEVMEPMEHSSLSNYNQQHIDINDIKLICEAFGDEFKESVQKTPITPDTIREVINIASGISKYRYDVHWKKAKKHNLICIQNNDTISLQKCN